MVRVSSCGLRGAMESSIAGERPGAGVSEWAGTPGSAAGQVWMSTDEGLS